MKILKLTQIQNDIAYDLFSKDYPFTRLTYEFLELDEFHYLSEKEERLLLRYIGGDKHVKIEVV